MKRRLFVLLAAASLLIVAVGCRPRAVPAVRVVEKTVEVIVEKPVVVVVEVTATPIVAQAAVSVATTTPTAITITNPAAAYLVGVMEATEVGIIASFAIDDLLRMCDAEPALFLDAQWREAMTDAIELGRRYSGLVRSLEALTPEKFAQVQSDLVALSVYYDLTLDSLEAWLVDGDEHFLEQYFFFVELATERLKACYGELMPLTQGDD